MSLLSLTPEKLLTTTRSVRKRLDFPRSVKPALIRECLELAVQAALIPLAHTLGTDFKSAPRIPLDTIVHWDKW